VWDFPAFFRARGEPHLLRFEPGDNGRFAAIVEADDEDSMFGAAAAAAEHLRELLA